MASGGERRRAGNATDKTPQRPSPENRIARQLTDFSKESFEHDLREWRLAPW